MIMLRVMINGRNGSFFRYRNRLSKLVSFIYQNGIFHYGNSLSIKHSYIFRYLTKYRRH